MSLNLNSMNSVLTVNAEELRHLIAKAEVIAKDRLSRMTDDHWRRVRECIKLAESRLPDHWRVAVRSEDGIHCVSDKFKLKAILSGCIEDDGKLWMHFSLSADRSVPNWEQMVKAKNIFLGEDSLAVQVFPRKVNYVNIHKHVLHLWECLDSDPVPDFSSGSGTI